MRLSEEKRNDIRDYEYHKEAISMHIALILKEDHPKSKALYDLINRSEKNKRWYIENINKFKLVPNWIEVLWDIYDLEDIMPSEKIDDIDEKKWKKEDAEKHLTSLWKTLPNWSKLISILPLELRQSFLSEVMWLDKVYLWSWENREVTSKDRIVLGDKILKAWRLRGVKLKEV